MPIRLACIGAGNHATWTLYPTLQYLPDVEMVTLCDLDAERLHRAARRFGVPRVYQSFEDMLVTESYDAVLCCGGPALHAIVTERCLEVGCPLFIEKPPAPTAASERRLAEMADSRGVPIMVGFMHRFSTAFSWARRAMAESAFGDLVAVTMREGLCAVNPDHMLFDSAIHHIDLLGALAGEVEWIFASRQASAPDRAVMAVILGCAGGVLAQLQLNTLESLGTPGDIVEVHGNRGQWLRIDNWTSAVLHRPVDAGQAATSPSASSLLYEHSWTAASMNRSTLVQGYVGELEYFVDCVRQRVQPHPDLWDGYRALRIIEAIRESIQKGEKVAMGVV